MPKAVSPSSEEEADRAAAIRLALSRKELAATRHRAALGRALALSEHDVLAVQHLARAGTLTPTQLASLLRLTSGGITALIQRLERRGFVRRAPNPRDRRSSLLELTDEIERRAGDAVAPLVSEIEDLVAALGERDRKLIQRFLDSVAHAAEREADALSRLADRHEVEMLKATAPRLLT